MSSGERLHETPRVHHALGGGAAPLAARAEQAVRWMPRIGVIDDAPNWDHFRQGLRDLGYVERQNIAIEYRSAQDNVDRLTRAALELVSLRTDVRYRAAPMSDSGSALNRAVGMMTIFN